MRPRITVIGSLNTDFTLKAPRLPGKGETLPGKDFRMAFGGKGANQALATARLGAEVFLSGRVGSDLFGDKIIQNLSLEGINTDYIIKDPGNPTGSGMIIVDDEGDNYILLALGANMAYNIDDLRKVRNTIANSDFVLLQFEIPMEVISEAVKIAIASNVPVILDPAPACCVPEDLFSKVDILVPNQNEAEFYTKVKVTDEKTASEAAEKLVLMGAKKVVVKLGKDGALFYTREEKVYVPGVKIKAEDPTAAGDAFAGALAVALSRKETIKQSLEYANYVGAFSATRLGAQPSLPTKEEIEEFIKIHSMNKA